MCIRDSPQSDVPTLGDRVSLNIQLQNGGPSVVPRAKVNIYIPTQDAQSGTLFFLYPGTLDVTPAAGSMTRATVTCDGLNPNKLEIPGNSGRRRRRCVCVCVCVCDKSCEFKSHLELPCCELEQFTFSSAYLYKAVR